MLCVQPFTRCICVTICAFLSLLYLCNNMCMYVTPLCFLFDALEDLYVAYDVCCLSL